MDTHKTYQELRDAKFDDEQAKAVMSNIHASYEELYKRQNKVVDTLNMVLLEMQKFRADVNKDLGDIRAEIHKQGNTSIRWFIGIAITLGILIVGFLRFFPANTNAGPVPIQYHEHVQQPVPANTNAEPAPIQYQESVRQPAPMENDRNAE